MYNTIDGEVGEALGLATGTVYVRLSEGRRLLRQIVLEQERGNQEVRSRTGRQSC
jgi:DNA-directed RNA polymerase specialized sigma24 family protein